MKNERGKQYIPKCNEKMCKTQRGIWQGAKIMEEEGARCALPLPGVMRLYFALSSTIIFRKHCHNIQKKAKGERDMERNLWWRMGQNWAHTAQERWWASCSILHHDFRSTSRSQKSLQNSYHKAYHKVLFSIYRIDADFAIIKSHYFFTVQHSSYVSKNSTSFVKWLFLHRNTTVQ